MGNLAKMEVREREIHIKRLMAIKILTAQTAKSTSVHDKYVKKLQLHETSFGWKTGRNSLQDLINIKHM